LSSPPPPPPAPPPPLAAAPPPAPPLPQAVKIVTAHRRRYAVAHETFLQLLAGRKGKE
jgi:hypothetical protein